MHEAKYNPNAKRKPTTQSQLDSVAEQRTGEMKVRLVGETHKSPVPVKSCKFCKKPAPMIEDSRFVCRECVILFRKKTVCD